ncbi:hypothetical protein DOR48_21265, partial [Salmonella enterica subsp. houtenae]
GGLCAVVPCQWWRIIGRYFSLTRPKCKKKLNRSFFKQHLNQKLTFAWFLNKNEPVRARFI